MIFTSKNYHTGWSSSAVFLIFTENSEWERNVSLDTTKGMVICCYVEKNSETDTTLFSKSKCSVSGIASTSFGFSLRSMGLSLISSNGILWCKMDLNIMSVEFYLVSTKVMIFSKDTVNNYCIKFKAKISKKNIFDYIIRKSVFN